MIKFKSLNQSKQFIKILKKKKLNTKYYTIYFDKNSENFKKSINKYLNISFVMKKNIGNAVIRNRIKRKLKSAVQRAVKKKQLWENYGFCFGFLVIFCVGSTDFHPKRCLGARFWAKTKFGKS